MHAGRTWQHRYSPSVGRFKVMAPTLTLSFVMMMHDGEIIADVTRLWLSRFVDEESRGERSPRNVRDKRLSRSSRTPAVRRILTC